MTSFIDRSTLGSKSDRASLRIQKPSARCNSPRVAGPPEKATALTDLGNAERFTRDYGENCLYSPKMGTWFVWDGTRWKKDLLKTVHLLANETVRSIHLEVAKVAEQMARCTDDHLRKSLDAELRALRKHATKSESRRSIEDMVNLAGKMLAVSHEDFDGPDTHLLLNCPNGTVDLRTGEVREHRRGDKITKITKTSFDASAKAPKFMTFIEEILPDKAVREFVQRLIGYSLTGLIRDHIFPVFHGDGSNGKSTLLETTKKLLGTDYATGSPEGFLEFQKHRGHETEIASLWGVRMVIASETNQGATLNESRIKKLTGGDSLRGRFMRQDHFEFEPTAKFITLTNHKPKITVSDGAILRRICLVPFDVKIPDSRIDVELGDKLVRDEGPGILAWAIRGTQQWFEHGRRCRPPKSVQAATQDYIASEDVIGRFLEEECTCLKPGDRNVRCKPTALFRAYQSWCSDNGERTDLTSKAFLAQLQKSRGYASKKSDGDRWIFGIGILASVAEETRS